jgi:rRNA-processing protein FCF1
MMLNSSWSVDGNFLHAAVSCRSKMTESLERIMSASVKPSNLSDGIDGVVTTACVMAELRKLDLNHAWQAARGLEKRRCNHYKDPIEPSQCILDIIGKMDMDSFFKVKATRSTIVWPLKTDR